MVKTRKESQENEITKDEVYQVLNYAQDFYNAMNAFKQDNSMYNTSIEKSNLVGLSDTQNIPKTYEEIIRALANESGRDSFLQSYSKFYNTFDSIYGNIIDYYTNLLSFDWSYHCINASSEEYGKDEYNKDVERVYKFFNNFSYKKEFKRVLKNMLIRDTYYCWLRDKDGSFNDDLDDLKIRRTSNYSLQMLPQDRCEISGTFSNGYLFDFDLNYFYNSNINPENFDPSIIELLGDNYDKSKKRLKSVITSNQDLKSTNGKTGLGYTRVDVTKGAWCFKFNDYTYETLPPLSHLMKTVFNNDVIEKLQKDKDFISANAVILGSMAKKRDGSSATDKDPFLVQANIIGALMELARKGINRNIKQIALPTDDNKLFQFSDNNPHMYDNKLKQSAGLGVGASSIIYSTENLSQFAMENAIIKDYEFVAKVYRQFEEFLNFYVNRKTKKYKFKISMDGCTMPFVRNKNIENFHKLSSIGIQVNISKWASLYGMQPQELKAMMEESKNGFMANNLGLLLNSNIGMNGGEDQFKKNGRPPTDDNEDTNESKEYL